MKCVYSECFVFHGVLRENIREIHAKCEIRKVYSQPNRFYTLYANERMTCLADWMQKNTRSVRQSYGYWRTWYNECYKKKNDVRQSYDHWRVEKEVNANANNYYTLLIVL